MPIRVDDKELIRAALGRAAGVGAETSEITEAAAVFWQAIVKQLEPLIGLGGVQALSSRCMYLTGVVAEEPAPLKSDSASFTAMRLHLQNREAASALDVAADFFDCFSTLLGSLIGAAMTARLLNPVWAEGHTDEPAQENDR